MELFTGVEYLKIDGANHLGKDKETFSERIEYYEEVIEPRVFKTSSNHDLLLLVQELQPEEPELLLANVIAYRDYLRHDLSGYMVSFDSTASGIQIMSAITGCFYGMLGTNLVDPNSRIDVYTEIFKITAKKYKELTKEDIKLSRNHIKKAIMVLMYGGIKSVMKEIEHNQTVFDLLMETCAHYISGATLLREGLLDCVDPNTSKYVWLSPDGFEVENYIYTLYLEERVVNDKRVKLKYKDIGTTKYYKGNVANLVHSIDATLMREVIARCNYDRGQLVKAKRLLMAYKEHLSPTGSNLSEEDLSKVDPLLKRLIDLYQYTDFVTVRIFDYINQDLDAMYIVLNSKPSYVEDLLELVTTILKYKPFEVICTHDCFRCLPNNMNYVRYWYNNVLADIAQSNSLEFMLKCLPNSERLISFLEKIPLEKINYIRNANYALC